MNDKSTIEKMRKMYLQANADTARGTFGLTDIYFQETHFIDECNTQIIQQLPERIVFPEWGEGVVIDENGITHFKKMYSWSEIAATAIKEQRKKFGFFNNFQTILLIGLKIGRIVEIELYDNAKYLHQIGHLIELYKVKFKRHNTL